MSDVIESFKEEVRPCPLGEEAPDPRRAVGESELNRARTNKFNLVIDLPKCFSHLETSSASSNGLLNLSKLQINVWGTVVPSISVPSIEVPVLGGVIKASGHAKPAYDPVTVDFTVDHNYENYHVIYRWLDIMSDDRSAMYDAKNLTRTDKSTMKHYSTIWTLYALDEYNKSVAKWEYWGAYPVQLGQIQLSKRDPSDLESQLTFDFSFMIFDLVH